MPITMKDKAYRAVIAANKAQEEYTYHLVGGAAGTVSPSKLFSFSVKVCVCRGRGLSSSSF